VRPVSPFRYDASAPLDYRNTGRVNGAYPIEVDDISYAVPGGRVEGYLALPPGKAHVPAVIYLHGSGENRERFLLPAAWAAGRRAVGMTLTLPSSSAGPRPSGLTPAQSLARDRRIFASDVVAARRAVDLLQSLRQVDPKRIGLVGWSLGAALRRWRRALNRGSARPSSCRAARCRCPRMSRRPPRPCSRRCAAR
jgi:dienelactone hydrolase